MIKMIKIFYRLSLQKSVTNRELGLSGLYLAGLLCVILLVMGVTGNKGVGDPASMPMMYVYWAFLATHIPLFLLFIACWHRSKTVPAAPTEPARPLRHAPKVNKAERKGVESSLNAAVAMGADLIDGRVGFFRTEIEDSTILANLTLAGLTIGKSDVGAVSFFNSALQRAEFNWTDFTDTDFSEADLTGADLRACVFVRVKFTGAGLSDCDLRQSSFEECEFTEATLDSAKLTQDQRSEFELSDEQIRQIDWQAEDGPEPEGG